MSDSQVHDNTNNDGCNENEKKNSNERLIKVVQDLLTDLSQTFPEIQSKIDNLHCNNELNITHIEQHIQTVLPERFFDILYQNDDMFKDTAINCEFLPNIDFRYLWNLPEVSSNTKETIWKYLQLILFSTVNNLEDKTSFGDTAKLFEAINEDELKEKLANTMDGIQDMFENMSDLSGSEENTEQFKDIPSPETIHDHIQEMLEGKIGKLASEIAEETAKSLNLDMQDGDNIDSVFRKLMKNPQTIMNLVKTVGGKLDSKIKSGEIKESELMEEASELMNKMKNMPGMDNLGKMFNNMNMPKGGKFNMNAFQKSMAQNQTRDRMKQKLEERQKQKEAMLEKIRKKQQEQQENQVQLTEKEIEELEFTTYSAGEKPQRSVAKSKKKKKSKK